MRPPRLPSALRIAAGSAMSVRLAAQPAPRPAPQSSAAAALAVSDALRAVEGGRAAAHDDSLHAVLAGRPGDRLATLGRATIARLMYTYPRADSLYAALADGSDDPIGAYALLGRAQAAGARGSIRSADSLFARAATIGGAMAPALRAEALLGRAGTQSRLVGAAAALSMLDSARATLATVSESLTADDAARLNAALLCGAAGTRAGAGTRAVMATIDSGLAAVRARGPRRVAGACHFARAQEYARVGDMARAVGSLDSAATRLRDAGDRVTLTAALQWRGYALVTVGDYEHARQTLGAALAEGTASEALQPMAWALLNVSETARAMGDRGEAVAYARRAEALFVQIGDERGAANARGTLAALAVAARDTLAARVAFTGVRAWSESADDYVLTAAALRGLSTLAEQRRDWAAASAYLDSANALMLRRGGPRWAPSLAWSRGRFALRRGDGATAERELRVALPGFVPSQGNQRFRILAAIAEARLRQGDVAGADSLLHLASDALDAWRATLSDSRLRALVYQIDDPDETASIERVIAGLAAAGRVPSAFDLAERRRARMLRDAVVRAASTAAGGRSTPAPLSLDDVARALPARAALALAVAGTGDAFGTLFIVTLDRTTAYTIPSDDSLRVVAERLRARVEDGADATGAARALGAALFGARGERLPRGLARLVVVPDGVLHHVPLAVLDPDGRGPFGERVALSVAPSATIATLLRERPRDALRPARVLAVGDPAFDARQTGDDLRDDGATLPRLPRSADEARAAARLARDSRVLLGAEASEAALRTLSLREFTVLHVATHATVDEARPWASLVALAPGGGHDGFLRATDLAALPLDADLVVLSACGTAGGAVLRGEGVTGFTAPLLAAGARAVVATEWALRDGEAARGVAAFYDGLRDGLSVDEAMRRAQQTLRQSGAPAREWAAFSVIGDGTVRPLPIARRGWLTRVFRGGS